jgi:TonB family protein
MIGWRGALAILPLALALPAFAAAEPAADAAGLPIEGAALIRTWAPAAYPPDALKENVGGMAMIRMIVDEKGVVASARVLDATDPRLGAAALAAARKWVFTPALDAGRPVACSMDAPFEFSPAEAARNRKPGLVPPADQTPQPSPRVPAKTNATYSADYPDSLLERKLSGFVRFECTVTAQGRATAVRVVSSTHADFVLPALRSLDRWEFTPGMQGDLPVQSTIGGDITFDATAAGPADVLAANHITAPDGTPPAAHPEPRVVADPVWPFELLAKGEGGSAAVLYTVDEDGHPRDVQVQSATKPEFGEALVAAVEACVYLRATDGTRAVSVPLMQRAEFPAVLPGAGDDSDPVARLVAALQARQVGGSRGLDEKLTPVYRVAPEYPGILRKKGFPAGKAEIEFIIDRDGRARLPRIVSATSEEFGWAAATAVSQWIFRAPLRNGQPADVSVRIPFDFKSPPH